MAPLDALGRFRASMVVAALATVASLVSWLAARRRRRLQLSWAAMDAAPTRAPSPECEDHSSRSRPSTVDMLPLGEKLTVILTTSPVGRHPDTDLIDEVIGSMQLVDGVHECRLIIVCDGYRCESGEGVAFTQPKYRVGIVDPASAANYEEYKARLRAKALASSTLEVLELESRHGFGFAVKAALEVIRTPYVFVMQHDRPILGRVNLPRLVAAMERDPARLKYIGLPSSSTLPHQYQVLSKYSLHLQPIFADPDGLQLVPLIQWYDSAHVCQTEYYRNFVFDPKRKLVARGGFIEDKLGQFQLADIRSRGVDVAHPQYGTFVAVGPACEFGEPLIGHLNGRDPRNVKKFRFVVPGANANSGDIAGAGAVEAPGNLRSGDIGADVHGASGGVADAQALMACAVAA